MDVGESGGLVDVILWCLEMMGLVLGWCVCWMGSCDDIDYF